MGSLPSINANRDDWVSWKLNTSGKFTTISAYKIFQRNAPNVEWSSLLMGPGKIPRHLFILWLAIRERLPMRDKQWIGQGEDKCVLCDEDEVENHNHMFFMCDFSRKCMTILCSEVKFYWPYTDWKRGIRWAARKWRGKHLVNCSYRILLATLIYMIWRERNSRIFEQKKQTPEVVARRVLNLVKDKLISMNLEDSLQSRAVRRLWHIAW